jgi:hypothetical protein
VASIPEDPGRINQAAHHRHPPMSKAICMARRMLKKIAPSTGLGADRARLGGLLGSAEEPQQHLRPLIGQAKGLNPKLLADLERFKRRTLPRQIGIHK